METRLADKEYGPIVTKVTDSVLITELKEIIMTHWKVQDDKVDYFPAPQPISLERKDMWKLVEYDYVACVKSDGMRFVFIIYENKCSLVDRAFKIFNVGIEFCKGSHSGGLMCIFDGELITNNTNQWVYIIHDCINLYNRDIGDCTFTERYYGVDNFVGEFNCGIIKNSSGIKLTKKLFYNFKNLKLLQKIIANNEIDHKTDGLIFTPKNRKIGKYTQYDLFKWKPMNSHTFDFKVYRDANGITAYVNKNSSHVPYAFAKNGSVEEKIFSEYLHKNCKEFVNNCIVECGYDAVNDLYKPILVRGDKIHPNSVYTVNKTLVNIKENITLEELIELSESK